MKAEQTAHILNAFLDAKLQAPSAVAAALGVEEELLLRLLPDSCKPCRVANTAIVSVRLRNLKMLPGLLAVLEQHNAASAALDHLRAALVRRALEQP